MRLMGRLPPLPLPHCFFTDFLRLRLLRDSDIRDLSPRGLDETEKLPQALT